MWFSQFALLPFTLLVCVPGKGVFVFYIIEVILHVITELISSSTCWFVFYGFQQSGIQPHYIV